MKINKRSSSKRLIVSIAVVVVLLAAAVGYFLWKQYQNNHNADDKTSSSSIDLSTPTKEQIKEGNDAKNETIKNDSNSNDTPDKSISNEITSASVSGDTLYIRNEIMGVYADGTCKLTLTKGSETITRQAGLQPGPQSTTCKGFNIPTSQLSRGTWNVILTVTINDKTADATTTVSV
jgi:cytoskeletal protein RodZ